MGRKKRSGSPQVVSMSALDLLSAGLGAVVLLMLIFSAVQGQKRIEQQESYFIVNADNSEVEIGFKAPDQEEWNWSADNFINLKQSGLVREVTFTKKLNRIEITALGVSPGKWFMKLTRRKNISDLDLNVEVVTPTGLLPFKVGVKSGGIIFVGQDKNSEISFEVTPGN